MCFALTQSHKYFSLVNVMHLKGQVVRRRPTQLMPSTAQWSAIALSRRAVARAIIIVILGASDLMLSLFVSACTLTRTHCLQLCFKIAAQEAHKLIHPLAGSALPPMIKAFKTLFNGVMRKFSKCLRVCHSQLGWGEGGMNARDENDDRPLLNCGKRRNSSWKTLPNYTCVHALQCKTTLRQLVKPQCN